jgi:hypothetical protein
VITAIGTRLSFPWILRTGPLALALALAAASARGDAPPAAMELTLDSAFTGSCQLAGPGGEVDGGTSQAVTFSLLNRRALPATGWYWGWGIQAENYSFGGRSAKPGQLADYAGIFSVEYYQAGENVAALTFRPGWYFQDRAAMAAWDVPVDLTVGVPISGPVSGVVGFSNARFYHHAVPVIGVIWVVNPRVRLELAYPEPALVIALGATGSLRLGGQLTGAGFLADSASGRTPVEFTSYQAGAEFSLEVRRGVRLALGGGVELERSFDFFAQNRRLHGSGAPYASLGLTFSR